MSDYGKVRYCSVGIVPKLENQYLLFQYEICWKFAKLDMTTVEFRYAKNFNRQRSWFAVTVMAQSSGKPAARRAPTKRCKTSGPPNIGLPRNLTHAMVGNVYKTSEPVSMHLCAPDFESQYNNVAELRQEGASDYVIQPLFFTNGEVHAISWSTRRPGGFDDGELAAFDAVAAPFARATEIYCLRRTAVTFLDTYVAMAPAGASFREIFSAAMSKRWTR